MNDKEAEDWWKAEGQWQVAYEKPRNEVAEGIWQVIGQLSLVVFVIMLLEKFC